jgi:hypothetical protein
MSLGGVPREVLLILRAVRLFLRIGGLEWVLSLVMVRVHLEEAVMALTMIPERLRWSRDESCSKIVAIVLWMCRLFLLLARLTCG